MAHRRQNGFTSFEALIAIAVLAIVATALSSALSAGRAQTKNAQNTLAATLLAQAMMDEILRLPYSDPNGYTTMGPDPGETSRPLYNNIDDYHGYTDGPANLTDIAGNPYPSSMQGFTRAVTVTTATLQPSGWTVAANGEVVTVTVSSNGTTLVTLQRFVPPS